VGGWFRGGPTHFLRGVPLLFFFALLLNVKILDFFFLRKKDFTCNRGLNIINIMNNMLNFFPTNLLCVCLSKQCTMRDSSNTSLQFFSARSLHGIYLLITNKDQNSEYSAQSTQTSESGFLAVMHELGPISTSLALDEARRASPAKSYTLVTHAYIYRI
jgi:hypothetical protein